MQSLRNDDSFVVSNDDGTSGYYPMVSCFRKGIVELNPGPELEFPPEDLKDRIDSKEVKLFCERYKQKVVEDVTNDIMDEVTNKYLDRLEKALVQ
ncbi:unnamed protein product [Ambrosiozyma monospora]|uniref:Unnamed protein product n=1 Tax=Ambrosiozyma monospora TaxID=43982 RepID=A0ACB5T5B2_AMBMO|nr:unnamed protein product [Ambrosiozyma monospora]